MVLGRIIGLVLQVHKSEWLKYVRIIVVPFIVLNGVRWKHDSGIPRDECSIGEGDILECLSWRASWKVE